MKERGVGGGIIIAHKECSDGLGYPKPELNIGDGDYSWRISIPKLQYSLRHFDGKIRKFT